MQSLSRIPDTFDSVLFDLDGTLIDSATSILQCFHQVILDAGYQPNIPISKDLIGPPLHETLSKLCGEMDKNKLGKLTSKFMKLYDCEGYKSSLPYDGANSLLNQLYSNGLSLYIVTNKREIPTIKIIEYLGWKKYFKKISALDSYDGIPKNKSAVLHETIRSCEIDISRSCYVGDTYKDYEAALQNNLYFIFARWGYGVPKKNSAYLTCANHLSEIHDLVLSRNE
jgi:phosphoglycolate phosphatase